MELRQRSDVAVNLSVFSFLLGVLPLHLNWANDHDAIHFFRDDEIKSDVALREIDTLTSVAEDSCNVELRKIVSWHFLFG